jgi:glycosyltransferase involved in cell wall biosynthesis
MREWKEGLFPGHFLYGATHLDKHGIKVVCHKHKLIANRFLLAAYVAMKVLLCREKFDAIYCSQFQGMEFIILLRSMGLFRKPIIVWQHPPLRKKSSWIKEAISKFFYKGIDHMFVFSKKILDESVATGKTNPEKFSVCHWGPDLQFYDKIISNSDRKTRKGFISTGKEKRDYPTILKAFIETQKPLEIYLNHTNGNINYDNLIKDIKITPNIDAKFINRLMPGDIAKRVDRAQCIVICCMNTNYTVGLTTLVEAYALGIPVITSHNLAYPIDVEKENIGLNVEYGDLNGWINAINYIADNPDKAEQMGLNARKIAESRYNLEITAKEVAEVINSYSKNK